MYNKHREGFLFMVIYITTNLINKKRYVGKDSKNDPKYLGSGTMFLEDLIKHGKDNFKKKIIEHCVDNEELIIRESYWIQHYDAVKSDKFYNLVDFSAGWNIHKLGKEKYDYVCANISKNTKGILRPQLSFNQARKDKLRKANKGVPKPEGFGEMLSKLKLSQNIKFSQEHKDKISKGKLGKKQPQSFIDKKNKPITQLDKEDNIVNEFISINEATSSNPKFKRSNISCCLTGFSKTAYGFKWIYK